LRVIAPAGAAFRVILPVDEMAGLALLPWITIPAKAGALERAEMLTGWTVVIEPPDCI
jgi:hypothetical protein